ncbi:hypothetical protein MSG28_003727 [Choristoneura fumiferana]|uniref:Uncharacterized protein n=1 Tax=Choristoneura fumiferana TaxID=7141 RepID=A0ACC0KGS0_CHOFU|nr:hypothetical protein MSG28_003727 [Choristoneura fumiferana]
MSQSIKLKPKQTAVALINCEKVQKKLKDISFKIQTASLKGRREVVKEIQDVLSTPGITEPAVRYVCRVLMLTLHRYRDSTSQSYVKNLLAYLASSHREWTLRSLLPVLLEVSEQLRNTATSKSTCQSGLFALRWSTVVAEGALRGGEEGDGDGVDYAALVLAQANLLAVVVAYGDKRQNEKAFSKLHASWLTLGGRLDRWVEALVAQAPDSGPHVCVAFSALCRHARLQPARALVAPHKAKMLESFIKSLISVKARPNANYIAGCAELLALLDRADLHDVLLPALHKAMLRSPETIIEAVGAVFDTLEKAMSSKSATGPVRVAGVCLVSRALRACGCAPAQAAALRPPLLQAVAKAVQQPLQAAAVNEGICAMLALALMDTERELPAAAATWAALAHPDKHVVLLCRTVLEQYPSVAGELNSPVYRALTLMLLSTVKSVRTLALEEVKSLLAHEDRAQMARYLVLKLNEVLEEGKVFGSKEKSPPEEKTPEVTGKMILDSVQAICSFRDALRASHHPLACGAGRRAWARTARYLRLDPKTLVALYANNLKNTYVGNYTPSETLSNVVSTLSVWSAEVAGAAVAAALRALQEPALLRVTRHEYFTYLTSEGELYDKSGVPGRRCPRNRRKLLRRNWPRRALYARG